LATRYKKLDPEYEDPVPDVSREELVRFAADAGIPVKHYWHKHKLVEVIEEELAKRCENCRYCVGVEDCPEKPEKQISDRDPGTRKSCTG